MTDNLKPNHEKMREMLEAIGIKVFGEDESWRFSEPNGYISFERWSEDEVTEYAWGFHGTHAFMHRIFMLEAQLAEAKAQLKAREPSDGLIDGLADDSDAASLSPGMHGLMLLAKAARAVREGEAQS